MLATVDRLKKALSIPFEDISQDEMLEFYLQAASSAIETYCKRKFGRSTYIETLDGNARKYVLLTNYPVVSVASVSICGKTTTDYELETESGLLFRHYWPSGKRNIQVEFAAGYILPGGSETSTLPKEIELACVLLAKTQMRGSDGIQSERVGDLAVTYFNESEGLPSAVKSLVGPYVNRRV